MSRHENGSSSADGAERASGLIRFPTSAVAANVGGGGDADDPLLHGYSEPPSPIAEASPPRTLGGRAAAAWRRVVSRHEPRPRYRSGYLTLIPLSDSRLQPRRTRLVVGVGLLAALFVAAGVFVAVPRNVTVGPLDMHSIRMHFNASTMNYRIVLGAKVPVLNPNYFSARISGNLSISFYDAAAGWQDFGPIDVPRRSFPSEVRVKVDASNLPGKWTAVVIGCCLNFPRRLIFFLTATFKVRYFLWSYELPYIDTYFILDCDEARSGTPDDDADADWGWGDTGGGAAAAAPAALAGDGPEGTGGGPWRLRELTREEARRVDRTGRPA